MPRKSTRSEKNMYFLARENAGLTREEASEKLEFISDDRIARIELDNAKVEADEVLAMAKCYNAPLLVNNYCTNECPIGKKYVPKVTETDLSMIALQIMDSVNGLEKNKENLVSITADGIITDDERPTLEAICKQLDKISSTAGALKIWMEDKLS